jgi:hypothetical protein
MCQYSKAPQETAFFAENRRKCHFFSKNIAEKFGSNDFLRTFAIPNENNAFEKTNSRIAQLVRASDC